MKIAALMAIVLAAGVPLGKGRGNPSDCTRFNVKGTAQAVSDASFTLKPAKGAAIRVAVTPTTQVFWTGQGTLAGPKEGERAWAKGQQCGSAYTATWVLFGGTQ